MTSTGKLSGKVTIVTGGGGGFGGGIVRKFASEGARVIVVDIHFSAATQVASAWPSSQVLPIQADISTEEGWTHVLDFTTRQFGHLDVVVNNAGLNTGASASISTSSADWDRMIRVNLKSLYYSTKVIIPYFVERKQGGLFINVSSISASRPRPGVVWYAASKAALTTASKGLALEWASQGIRFNIIQPVLGDTAMGDALFTADDGLESRRKALETIPLGRLATPEDIGNTAGWLASDEATMLTGATIDVDGGRGV